MALSSIRQGFSERLLAVRTAWQRGEALNQNQLAAAVADAWSRPRAYRTTQPSDSKLARQTWARARAVYRRMQSLQEFDVTIDVAPVPARSSATGRSVRPQLQVVRRIA